MEACGILIDLSEPVESSPLKPVYSQSPPSFENLPQNPECAISDRKSEDSHNSLADSIEIERSCDRRGSYSIDGAHILQDLKEISSESDSGLEPLPHRAPGVQLLEDEEFDFDLPLSPAVRILTSPETVEDDEEVFIGPVGFTEKCVATVVSEIAPLQEPPKPLSPLKPHQIAEIFKEAQLVVYRINNEETEEGESRDNSESEAGRKRKSQTPVRHQRKGTFTESPDAFIRLPENVVKAMPVIDIEINDPFQSKVEENKENCTREVGSRLAPPRNCRLPGSQLTSKNKTGRFPDAAASDTDDNCSVTSDTSEGSLPRPPVSGVANSKGSTKQTGLKRPSMLKAPGAASKSNENLSLNNHATSKPSSSASVGKTKIVPPSNPRRSLNVSSRKSLGLNTSALPNSTKAAPRESSKETEPVVRKGPSTRLSLVKPGSIAKPGLKAQQSTESRTRPGPMKALPTTSNIPDKQLTGKPALIKQMLNPEICTPIKADKKVQPKLLSNNFGTPVRSNSVSSCTPVSARRRSFLPTPQKTRSGSTSAIPQPSPVVRCSSTSSRTGSLSESPFVSRSLMNNNKNGKREIPKARHSIAGKTSPVKSLGKKAAVRGLYQGRRSLAVSGTTAR
uniref:G2 and S phase-expressed protein 1-like isoform X2 n=1 Tax=Crassostrea virginica TaxID=6565 RepID=A0A8B8B682_CRAVI|nr:G2 and S phase-expressed protein 1-like isoform X2 [Crassostrea virginica]